MAIDYYYYYYYYYYHYYHNYYYYNCYFGHYLTVLENWELMEMWAFPLNVIVGTDCEVCVCTDSDQDCSSPSLSCPPVDCIDTTAGSVINGDHMCTCPGNYIYVIIYMYMYILYVW